MSVNSYQRNLQSLHWYVLVSFPAANTPNIKAEPTLLAALIFSTFVDLQLVHFIPVDIGLPQPGQLSAEDEISLLQSGQVIKAINLFLLFVKVIILFFISIPLVHFCCHQVKHKLID